MRGYVDADGARLREHDIRAKTASDSASIGEAQERLGHTSTRTTAGYRRKPATVRSPLRKNFGGWEARQTLTR